MKNCSSHFLFHDIIILLFSWLYCFYSRLILFVIQNLTILYDYYCYSNANFFKLFSKIYQKAKVLNKSFIYTCRLLHAVFGQLLLLYFLFSREQLKEQFEVLWKDDEYDPKQMTLLSSRVLMKVSRICSINENNNMKLFYNLME